MSHYIFVWIFIDKKMRPLFPYYFSYYTQFMVCNPEEVVGPFFGFLFFIVHILKIITDVLMAWLYTVLKSTLIKIFMLYLGPNVHYLNI